MSTTASPEVTGGRPVTTRSFDLYRICLDRPRLGVVLRVATERFSRAQVALRSDRDGTQFTSGSLDGLLAQIGRSEDADPDCLDNLQVECRAKERSVTLVIAKDRATVTVSGCDAAWAHGKAEQLRLLLLRSGSSERPVHCGPTVCGLGGAVGAAAVAGAIVAASGGYADGSAIALAVAFTVFAGAAGALIGRRRVRRAKVHLYVAGPQPKRSLWARMTIMERLFTISTVVSLVSLCLSLLR